MNDFTSSSLFLLVNLNVLMLVSDDSSDWNEIHGKFIAINAANMSCACPRSPKGLSPFAHLADGNADLILVRNCSRLDFFKHLLRHTNKDDQVGARSCAVCNQISMHLLLPNRHAAVKMLFP